ncbi:hypothetical protein EJ110_NYTH38711 [Nymphaea thermarum]|nr:hypothetical protein EJ110_NYTH38711 [Nymphaea thermarum]
MMMEPVALTPLLRPIFVNFDSIVTFWSICSLGTHPFPHSNEENALVVVALRNFSRMGAFRTRGVAAGRIATVWNLKLGYTGHVSSTLSDQIRSSMYFEEFCGCMTGEGNPDKAKEWIEEVERIFELLKMPERNKVNYGSYLLKGDAKNWWQSTREIRFAGQLSISWKQFRVSFFSTYFPVHARDKKMQEFLYLQQNQLSLEEYIMKYRHLEVYCLHLYTTDGARACKFVSGLWDGLRSKVLTSRPRDLDEAVTMTRCIEEHWTMTQKDHHKKAGQHSHEHT